jgi:hypothetical protein
MKVPDSNIEGHDVALIELKASDRATLQAMAKRYGVSNLIDFLEGIVMQEQGPNIFCRFYG